MKIVCTYSVFLCDTWYLWEICICWRGYFFVTFQKYPSYHIPLRLPLLLIAHSFLFLNYVNCYRSHKGASSVFIKCADAYFGMISEAWWHGDWKDKMYFVPSEYSRQTFSWVYMFLSCPWQSTTSDPDQLCLESVLWTGYSFQFYRVCSIRHLIILGTSF